MLTHMGRAQVDVTWIKGIHRVLGTICGSVFGYLCMLRPETANSPYTLTVLLCAWCFVCSSFNTASIKYAAFLALYTGSVVILVQPPSQPHASRLLSFCLPCHCSV